MPERLLGKKIKTFNIVKKLGQGSFASVFQAYDDSRQNVVAVKITELSQLKKSKKLAELIKTQIAVLKSCKNQNVISYVDSFETSQFLFIVVQFCNGGDLEELLKKKTSLSEDQSVFFLKQILNGFKGLHEVGAMHRDFKTANVLLHDGVLKIADLGFAKQMDQTSIAKTVLGTSLTMAPEVLEEKPYGFQADIWSIGVVFYQMIYGKYPYNGNNDYVLLKSIKNTRPSYEGVNITQNTKDFLQKCLTVDPKNRMQWKQIHKHPLIKKNETSSLSTGVFKSKIKLNDLVHFYEKADLRESQDSLRRRSLELQMEVLPDNMLTQLVDMSGVLNKAQVLQQQDGEYEKFDHLYIGRRNDLMFFHKFIHPFIKNFEYLRINHSIGGFILSKKAYKQLSTFLTSMKQKKIIFYGQSHFEQYSKKPNYKSMMEMLEIDIKTMEDICRQYKSKIKLSSIQIQNELDFKTTKSNNYDALTNQIVSQYLRLLTESLHQIKPEHKKDLLRVISALAYYRDHPKPFSHEFDRLISTSDFHAIQNNLRKKNGIF